MYLKRLSPAPVLTGLFLAFALTACGPRTVQPIIDTSTAPVLNNPASGSASRLFEQGSVNVAVTEANAQAVAEGAIRDRADALRGSASDPSLFQFQESNEKQLVLDEQTNHPADATHPATYTVTFRQEHAGLPVEQTNVFVSLAWNGEILGIGADVFPDIALDVRPRLSTAQAATRGGVSASDLALSILPPGSKGDPFRLVWTARTGFERVLVDAITGSVDRVQLIRFAKLQANIPKDNPVSDPKSNLPLQGGVVRASNGDVTTGTDGTFTGTAPYVTKLDNPIVETRLSQNCTTLIEYILPQKYRSRALAACTGDTTLEGTGDLTWQTSDTATLGMLITHHAILAERAAVEGWGYTKMQGKILNVNRIPKLIYGSRTIHCNAFWNESPDSTYDSVVYVFLTGTDDPVGGCPITKDFEQYSDITFHEYGHGVFFHTYDNEKYPDVENANSPEEIDAALEAGAISEGFADFMACVMNEEQNLSPISPLEGDVRTCASAATYGQLRTLCGNDGACHNGGNIISGALYGALTASGVDRDAFMRTVFRAIDQKPLTMRNWGEAILSQTTDDGMKNAIRTSFSARGLTLSGTGATAQCGDGTKAASEACDGTSFGATTCSTTTGGARPNGNLTCTTTCQIETLGCTAPGPGTGGAGPGTYTLPGEMSRSYLLYVPKDYDAAKPTPLVIILGGAGGNADATLQLGWKAIADRDTVLLLSTSPLTNSGYGEAEAKTIEKAHADTLKSHNVATERVSLWGFSAGAHTTYILGLHPNGAAIMNGLAVQAGGLDGGSVQAKVWPPLAGARRVPVYISTGMNDTACGGTATECGGGLIGALRRDKTKLEAEGYTVVTREVPGQGHTYTSADVEASWDFLETQRLTTTAIGACTTSGCSTAAATQCSDTNVQTCQQTTQGTTTCLAWTTPSACTTSGQTCQGNACTATGSGASACATNGCTGPSVERCTSETHQACTLDTTANCYKWADAPCADGKICKENACVDRPVSPPVCGDDKRTEKEACDGEDLDKQTCVTLGFAGGTLTCNDGCQGFDVSQCTTGVTARCGDGSRTGNELCDDGNTLDGDLCSAACVVERIAPMPVDARLERPMRVGTAQTPVVFDCRRSLGYRLACAWDFGDGTTSIGQGDYTRDGIVDFDDLRYFVRKVYGEKNLAAPEGSSFDLTSDGIVDVEDVQVLINASQVHTVAHTYDASGSYTVTLTVSGLDEYAVVQKDTDTAPIRVRAGGSTTIVISATSQSHEDGITLLSTVQGGTAPYTYAWTQTAGPTTTITGAGSATAEIASGSATAALTFAVKVTDASGASARTTVTVTPNAVNVCQELTDGMHIGLLELGTREFNGHAQTKIFLPKGNYLDTDEMVGVGEEFMSAAFDDPTVDPKRRFVLGYGAGATAALLVGTAQAPDLAGIIHVNSDTLAKCTSATSSCSETINARVREAFDGALTRSPVAIAYQKGATDRGRSLRDFLVGKGYVEGKDLLVIETVGLEPSDAERVQLITWMIAHPADDTCQAESLSQAASPLWSWLVPTAYAAEDNGEVIVDDNCILGESCEDDLVPTPPISSDTLKDLGMEKIAGWLTGLVTTLAVLYAMWGGVQYMTAGGDIDRQAQAKRTIIYSLVGVVLTVLAYAIVMMVLRAAYSVPAA